MSEDNTRSYAFDIHTEEEKAMNHLEKFGFVLIEKALTTEEVKRATNYLWSDICKLNPGLKRENTETWNDHWFKSKGHSIAPGLIPGLAQSKGAWFVRGTTPLKILSPNLTSHIIPTTHRCSKGKEILCFNLEDIGSHHIEGLCNCMATLVEE